MLPLDRELQKPKQSITEFKELTIRLIQHLPNVVTEKHIKGDYLIQVSNIAGNIKYLRPFNQKLIIKNETEFIEYYERFVSILERLKNNSYQYNQEDNLIINRVVYTIQQMTGAGLDLFVSQNSARKHVGNRFEELIKSIFDCLDIQNKKVILQIPFETDEGTKIYKCENDLILSPHNTVKSGKEKLDEQEIVVSIKTTSKDRMGKIFIDKILLERFVEHPQKVIGIFLNDVQRKNKDNISFTLVSGLFMVYTKFLTKLNGIYYVDPPPNALKAPFNTYMKPFSQLILQDIWKMLAT